MSITLHNMKNIDGKYGGRRVSKILDTYHSNIEVPRPNGVQRFEIGEQIVWALNKKNAERKAKLYPHLSVIGG